MINMNLIPLPYAIDALEPVISAKTLSFHHGKHLQAYVDNLNKLLPGSGLEDLPLEEIVAKSSGALFNNAGQVLNHNMYFEQFRPASSIMPGPTGHLKTQIEAQWGTLEAFQEEFVAKGVSLFGSGWVWLSAAPDGSLFITQEPGANNPICRPVISSAGVTPSVISSAGVAGVEKSRHSRLDRESHLHPLLTFDVWEHAYYLDYQNRRAAHLEALWGIVDWMVVEERYQSK
jgi:Fe-Mn family superoxide dismutase